MNKLQGFYYLLSGSAFSTSYIFLNASLVLQTNCISLEEVELFMFMDYSEKAFWRNSKMLFGLPKMPENLEVCLNKAIHVLYCLVKTNIKIWE